MGANIARELKKISESYGSLFIEKQKLGLCSTIGIGGIAEAFYVPLSDKELEESLRLLKSGDKKFFIAGNGSNILFPDEGFRGVVIKLGENSVSWGNQGKTVTVSSGVKLSRLLRECMHRGLSGLEGMAGIPASVGGALKNNASSYSGSITGVLDKIFVLDDSFEKRWIEKREIDTDYRSVSWKGGGTILKAVFTFKETSPKNVKDSVRSFLLEKFKKQPCDKKTLGCVFKNPKTSNVTAWELIDGAGMRGKRTGGAVVSERHANFIINEGGATSEDVKKLIAEIKSRVEKLSGVRLEEEIEIINPIG